MRLRMTAATSHRALQYAARVIPKLGNITHIKAYRLTTSQRGVFTNREYLMISGENGTARINGVCWGYSGEGPRTVCQILKDCGIDPLIAFSLAYESDRKNKDGIDWEIWHKDHLPTSGE